MPLTKEELLLPGYKIISDYPGSYVCFSYSDPAIFNTMEDYAKQEAINFMNWTLRGDCLYSCTDEDQWTHIDESEETLTTEQLFEKYKQHKK